MTSVSLGLRASGSYGSLQPQTQNGVSLHQSIYISRRPSKTSLTGSREKEKISPYTFRCLSRRKVGLVVLVVFALFGFMTGIFEVNKEDVLDSPESVFDVGYSNNSYVDTSRKSATESKKSAVKKVIVCEENTSWSPSLLDASAVGNSSTAATILNHPCKNFAFSPPPPGDRRRIGPRPCPVCYTDVDQALALMPRLPSESPVLKHLTYVSESNTFKTEPHGGSEFGGYPSLKDRNDSFHIKESMTVHCGFVKGCRPGYQTGFDIDVADLSVLEQSYEVIVASAIFGNYDVVQQPINIGEAARNNVPFFMFIDEKTEAYMKNMSLLGEDKKVGLWRIIVVRNVPYTDSRRNGKVPKMLLHRLLTKTRFSVWIDGKLQLIVDPYQILERFLWRENASFAISSHYSRFDVYVEAEANKAAGKYNNASIDHQIEFYTKEGLTPYAKSKLPITSDVPEGCVILREHTPMTNLFSCLWFNDVDRFTARDQLSFSTVRDKILAQVNWNINMFLDCERRNFVTQVYHRDILEQRARMARLRKPPPPRPPRPPPPPPRVIVREKVVPKRPLIRHGKDKKPNPKKRRKVTPRTRYNSFS